MHGPYNIKNLCTAYIGLMLHVNVNDSYGGSLSSFCNPNFGTFFNPAARLHEYTEFMSEFLHTFFFASVSADKWIRESDAHIRCHGNNPCDG
jgi:hypothetical protein